MRKLKLQVQMTVDGFVGGPNGELDWMTWDWDDKLKEFAQGITDSFDTILLGRKMAPGFINYWENIQPDNPDFSYGKTAVETPKIVFSRTVKSIEGKNVSVENRDLKGVINELKNKDGKDIIVYGGASFVSNLIKENLIDELNIFVNPTAIGNGMGIFTEKNGLKLVNSKPYDCGIIVNTYNLIK